jgi:hypothetical protein
MPENNYEVAIQIAHACVDKPKVVCLSKDTLRLLLRSSGSTSKHCCRNKASSEIRPGPPDSAEDLGRIDSRTCCPYAQDEVTLEIFNVEP